ncbi:hypothetical protein [Hymenobacter wooponensis]|uniref:Uncharacterized protein n=1 Tax=Hymenobacter wooponensis TaxID=1525360 RepID=A0A4Z0MKD2_9BACT|nr:hypothetical protein [Hymenobacter wooponensis]TGD80302.1 hypothetical protein EU557_10685 [Hymenobacter wooponensis]
MAQDQTEKLLFEVRLNAEQLKAESDAVRKKQAELTTAIAATRAEQKQLVQGFKTGTKSEAEYGVAAQALSERLRAQTKEQAAATKQLESLTKVGNEAEGSINQLRAELVLTTAAYNALSKEERENSEAGKALQVRTRAISDELKELESAVGDNRRNVGNYKGSLEDLVKQMVKLQAQEKNLSEGSKELAENQRRQAGFMTAAQRAAAQTGQTYDEATKTIENYAKSIQPVVENLVALEAEQVRIVESGEEATESYRRIGFQIAATSKALDDAKLATEGAGNNLKKAAEDTQSFTSALLEAAGETETLGGAVQKATGLQEKWVQVQNLSRLAMGASTGAAKILKLALAATGIGAFLVILGSLVTYFTQTAEGGRILEQVFAQIGATVDVVTDRIGNFGKAAVQFFNGDFAQAAETAKASFRGVGDEIQRETKLALDLSKARQQLERDQANNISTNKRLLNDVERLKNLRDDENNSLAVRNKANEDAYTVEIQRQNTLADLAKRNLDIIKQDIERRGGDAKATVEQLRARGEAENEYYDILEDSAGKQNELITNRFALQKEGEEKLRKLRQDFLNLEIAQIDTRLAKVVVGSNQELQLEKDKLAKQRALALSEADLTANAKKAIEVKYRSDIAQLDREHLQRLRQQAAEAQQIAVATQLARAREGSQEEFALKAEAVQAQLTVAIASIDTRQSKEDQAAQEDKLRAEATKQTAELDFQQSLANLDTFLSQQRTLTNQQYADGQLTKAQHEAALAAIERAGQASRIVTLQDYGRSTTAEEETQSQQRLSAAESETERKRALAEQEVQIRFAIVEAAQQGTDTIINLFGEESAAGQAALAVKKILAVTEIGLNLQKELSAIAAAAAANPANVVTAGVAGISQTAILSGIAIAKAAFATAQVLAFEKGGVLAGPSHSQGGIPFAIAGRPGFEAEGDEIILTKGVHRNPALRPFASLLNILGGGKALYSSGLSELRKPLDSRFAEGGVVKFDPSWMPAAAAGRSGGSQIDYQQLAQAIADKVVPGFYEANKALPPPVTRLTELREKQDKMIRNEQRADS